MGRKGEVMGVMKVYKRPASCKKPRVVVPIIKGNGKLTKKQRFELVMAKIEGEWDEMKSYNKSFGCKPPTTWAKLLGPLATGIRLII